MSHRLMSFTAANWFIGTLINMIVQGVWFGNSQMSIINNLALFHWYSIQGFTVPLFNLGFLQGVIDLITWNYSFYVDEWVVVRWFWVIVFNTGLIWGIATNFTFLWGQLISMLGSLIKAVVGAVA